MIKNDLIDAIASKTGAKKSAVADMLNAFQEVIKETTAKGEEVAMTGFGSFKVRSRAARTGRNPQTGEPLKISASKVISFRAGKGLKDAINSNKKSSSSSSSANKKAATGGKK